MAAVQHQRHLAITRQQQFDDLCEMLRRNDRAAVEATILPWSGFFPLGYGRSYGEALLANSYISNIDLYIDGILPLDNTVSIEASTAPLLTYLRTSSSLRTVTWQCGYNDEDRDRVFQLGCDILHAIAQNPVIEKLEIEMNIRTDHTQNRPTSPEPVSMFARKPPISITEAITDCIRSSTSRIQRLTLTSYSFDGNIMGKLTKALEGNRSIVSLSLLGCRFDMDATSLLIYHMQYRGTNTNLQTLRIRGGGGHFQGELITFPLSMSVGRVLSQVVLGATIKRLILDDSREDNDTQFLCQELASTYALTQLERLYLCQRTSAAALNALAVYLPLTHTLRELMIVVDVDPTAQSATIVQALKKNGTLHRVTMTYSDERDGMFFRDSESSRVSAYCQRNIWTPKLVTQPRRDDNNTIGDCQTKTASGRSADCTDLFLFPTLFQVAQQSPRTAPTVMIAGLQALSGSSIGPSPPSRTTDSVHTLVEI